MRNGIPIDLIRGGRQAVVRYARLEFPLASLELDTLVLDTGWDCDLYGPLTDVEALWDQSMLRDHEISSLTRDKVPCKVGFASLLLGDATHRVQVYAHNTAPCWILGLPILRRYHLLLCDNDPDWPPGPSLVPRGGLGRAAPGDAARTGP